MCLHTHGVRPYSVTRVPSQSEEDVGGDGDPTGPSRFERLAAQLKGSRQDGSPAAPLHSLVAERSKALAATLKKADDRDKKRDRERIRERHRDERMKAKVEGRAKTGGYVLGAPVDEEGLVEATDDESGGEEEAPSELSDDEPHAPPHVDLEAAAMSLLAKKRRL